MKKGKSKNNGLLPNSLRIISSCLKTVSTNASTVASTVRSAGASVSATISAASTEDQKDQVTWAGFDRLVLGPSIFRNVLLLGYSNGFQVFDVEDASNFSELVSKRDGPVSFLQMQPLPATSNECDGYRKCHPLLLVVAGEDTNIPGVLPNGGHSGGSGKICSMQLQSENSLKAPSAVQFYSLRSHCYVHVLRFRSAVCMVRCSPRIVAVGLATQIYCFDALTLENKFSVLTYPVPQLAGQGSRGVNVGYGPMAVGPRWLAYASNSPLVSNTGRVSPQSFSSSPGVSPCTSPSGGSLVARYAMESSKQLASGIVNLGDMGYKTLSKYCHELLPDGSNSPVSSNSGWKVGRAAGTEMDNAGMVVVKDFVSGTIISQFKAHTSPISALCFDPSGTLLVTVSIYGNNINIFRIMPSCGRCSSGSQNFDWSSSHVHLYKLHRGITSAMIQDICFSHYSQWIAVVSSKGTCHVFVLSPFGGDAGFRILNSQGEKRPFLFQVLSLPWWSASSYITSQQSFPSPPPVVLSVVSRIKYSSFGWLSTVNGNASSTGKVFVPSGAVAAVFHNSLFHDLHHGNSRTDSLEHLLVYTPSGHVVQHGLLPSIGVEHSQGGSGSQSVSFVHSLEDELRVKVEPIKWWDVCRRSDWPERDGCILDVSFDGQDLVKSSPDNSCSDDGYKLEFLDMNGCTEEKKNGQSYCQKPNERSSWYISNAEVQISSLRLPIWQKPKICFYVMSCPRSADFAGGEFEIENLPVQEVELRTKELLPVFDHLRSAKSSLNDRVFVGEYPNSTCSGPDHSEEKITEEIVICHSKPASLSSTESSDGGSSRRIENFLDLDQINIDKSYAPIIRSPSNHDKRNIVGSFVLDQHALCTPSEPFENGYAHVDTPITSDPCMLVNKFPHIEMDSRRDSLTSFAGGIKEVSDLTCTQKTSSLDKVVEGSSFLCDSLYIGKKIQEDHCKELDLTCTQQASGLDKAVEGSSVLYDSLDLGNFFQEDHCKELDLTSTQQTSSLDKVVEGSSVLCNSLDLGKFFQEDHCKALDHDGGDQVTETGIIGVDCNNNQFEKVKLEENGEDDDMLGGIFNFSEEG